MKHTTNRPSMGLRMKLVLLVAISLTVVFGATAAFVIRQTGNVLRTEAEAAAGLLAEAVGDSIQVFGETADMDGLEMLLESLRASEDLTEVHAVRAPLTVTDTGEREGSEPNDDVERDVILTGKSRTIVDSDAHQIRFVLPSLAKESCISCHESAKNGDVLGVTSVVVSTARADAQQARQTRVVAGIFLLAIMAMVVLLSIAITRSVIRPVTQITEHLNNGADEVGDAAAQLAASSQNLAEGAGEQAASLEETSSALEQMAAMTRTNAENAKQANALSSKARNAAVDGDKTMEQLNEAMTAINDSSGQIKKIIKVIEEIAFQTNLLALNAAVEAARAGEHGKGFAVVADEVRNLAQRAAGAARETTALIDNSVDKAKEGTDVANEVGTALGTIVGDVTKVTDLVAGITNASEEQAQGVDQLNTAVSQMDRVTQQNAAGAEESASTSEELSAQAEALKGMVQELTGLIHGQSRDGATAPTYHPEPKRTGATRAPAATSDKAPCWEVKNCPTDRRDTCPAYPSDGSKCWMVTGTMCGGEQQGTFINKMAQCQQCSVYTMHHGMTQTAGVGGSSGDFMRMDGDENLSKF